MRIALLIVLFGISGYSFAETQDRFFQCMAGLKNDGRFSSIANHVALDGQGTSSRKMLSDKGRSDEQQKQAITEWIDARSQCVNLGPTSASIDLHMAFVNVVADLYNGQITFGEFNKKWQAMINNKNDMNMHEKMHGQPAK